MKKLVFGMTILLISSCAPISMSRSFVDAMDEPESEYMVPDRNFDVISGDSGYVGYKKEDMLRRTPASESDFPEWSEDNRLNKELRKKLASLSDEQKVWLKRNSHYFKSKSQKLYFLGLSIKEREDYLADRSLGRYKKRSGAKANQNRFRYSPRQRRELYLGMDESDVRRSWGNPHQIDVAGSSDNGFERWTFYESGSKRYVYFSQGKVEGWVTE